MSQAIRIFDWVGGTRASGRPCTNLEGDLRQVAALLGGIPRLQGGAGSALEIEPIIGGTIHPMLLRAIRNFQEFNLHDCGGWADGLLSPNGATLKTLNRLCPALVPPTEEQVPSTLTLASVTNGFRGLGHWDLIGTVIDGPQRDPVAHALEFRVVRSNVEESNVSVLLGRPWTGIDLDLATTRGTFDLIILWPGTPVSSQGMTTAWRCQGEFRCSLQDAAGRRAMASGQMGVLPGTDILVAGDVRFKSTAMQVQILLFGNVSPITRSGPDNGTESMAHPEGSGRISVAPMFRRRR